VDVRKHDDGEKMKDTGQLKAVPVEKCGEGELLHDKEVDTDSKERRRVEVHDTL